jgi:hypothetical protein
LNQDQRLHRVLQSQLVFAHLGKDCANVEVDVAGVGHLEAVFHGLLTEVQVVVLNFKRLFQERKGGAELLGSAKDTREVVVGDCPVAVSLVGERFCLFEQFECDRVVF